MDQRDELAAVFPHVPKTPLYDLIDKILPLYASEEGRSQLPEGSAIDPDAHGVAGCATEEALVEHYSFDISPVVGLDQPYGWHATRSIHIQGGAVGADEAEQERLNRPWAHDEKTLILHDRWMKDATFTTFPFVGCWLISPTEEVLAAMDRFAGEVATAAFAYGAGRFPPSELGPDLAARLATTVFLAVASAETSGALGVVTLTPAHGVPVNALRFVGSLVGDRIALDVLARVEAPVPVALQFRHDDGTDEVIYDLRVPPSFWTSSSTAADLVALARKQAHLAAGLAPLVQDIARLGSTATLLELAAAHPAFLGALVETDRGADLAGAADLVAAAESLVDVGGRVRALLAIGEPAAGALARQVRGLLPSLSAGDEATRALLCEVAREGVDLGVPFWKKILDKPGVFAVAWSTDRLRAALILDPRPLHRLVRRGAEDPTKAAVAWAALQCVLDSEEAAPDLQPCAAGLVDLVRGAHDEVPWLDRARVLARLSGEPAATLLAEILTAAQGRGELEGPGVLALARQEPGARTLLAVVGFAPLVLLDAALEAAPLHRVAPVMAEAVLQALVGEEGLATLDLACLTGLEQAGTRRTKTVRRALGAACDAVGVEDRQWRGALALFDPKLPRYHHWLDPRLPLLRNLLPQDLLDLQQAIGVVLEDAISRGAWDIGRGLVLDPVEEALRAQVRGLAGPNAEAVLGRLGEAWPTRDRVAEAAQAAGCPLDETTLDRFADEVLPRAYRAGLRHWPGASKASDEGHRSDPHQVVFMVMTEYWLDQPALVARHIAAVLPETDGVWRRGLVLALVALREPCGTLVPDALTKAMSEANDPDERVFLQTQRDTFARKSVAIEARKPARERVRKALKRLQIHARRARDPTDPVATLHRPHASLSGRVGLRRGWRVALV